MYHYRDTVTGDVFAYKTREEYALFGGKNLSAMSAAEVEAHVNPVKSDDAIANDARSIRDNLLNSSEWLVSRHRDEKESGIEATLSDADYSILMAYRQSLRDVPAQPGFPKTIAWPELPLSLRKL